MSESTGSESVESKTAVVEETDEKVEKEKMLEKYTKDAVLIFKDVRDHFDGFTEYEQMTDGNQMVYLEDLLEFYQKKYPRFSMTFPIVTRYMVQIQQFNKKAFVRYLKRLQSNPYKSEEEYCRRQSEYIMYLHMELNLRSKKKENVRVRKEAYELLLAEVAAFKYAQKQAKEKEEKNNGTNNIERREELKKLLTGL